MVPSRHVCHEPDIQDPSLILCFGTTIAICFSEHDKHTFESAILDWASFKAKLLGSFACLYSKSFVTVYIINVSRSFV
jgi:hypothetical protein